MCDGPQCGKMGGLTNSMLFLLSTITAISTLIVYVILVYYRTDGFQGLKNNSEKIQFNYLL